MFNIDKYLEKFSKNIQSADGQKKEIADTIKKLSGIDIATKDLEVKNFILHTNTSPAVKNKLFMYKKAILEGIASKNIVIADII
jgi:hypothetical protein